jgi:hypothetical protein
MFLLFRTQNSVHVRVTLLFLPSFLVKLLNNILLFFNNYSIKHIINLKILFNF